MKKTRSSRPFLCLSVLLALGLSATSTLACRIIVPPWPPRPIPIPLSPPPTVRPMEVKSHAVGIEIRRHVATVVVDAVFHNPNPQRIEGTYIFPVGRRASVSSFAMTVDGKTQEAELLPADRAREIYESIVRQMKDPALLEYLEQGVLKARVFPIEPHADVKVQLVYQETVSTDGGTSRFSYPLLSVKPDPGRTIQSLDINVAIHAEQGLKTVYTPGHDSVVERLEGGGARIAFTASKHVPERDFQLVFSESRAPVGVDFLAFRKDGQGYFMMAMAPDSELQAEEIAAKDVVFVIDTSGSMAGEKMRQAQTAIRFCLESLSPNDRFNVVAFATDVMPLSEGSVPFDTQTRERALAFAEGLSARGGTAIADALAFAGKNEVAPGHVGMIVFVTDGMPTIGETNPDRILERFATINNRRLYALGVGYDVNTRLLDGLATTGDGASDYVRPQENLEIALSNFYMKVAYPVLTDLRIDAGDVRLWQTNPVRLPGLFKGAQLIVTGKFEGEGTHTMTLSGEIAGARENFPFEANLDGDPRNAFIPRLWAMGRVAYLQDQIRAHGRSDELIDEIKRLGRHYGILTEYTSFLIVEEGVERQRLGEARRAFDQLEVAAERDAGGAAVESSRLGGRMRGAWALSAPSASAAARESKALADTYRASGVAPDELARYVRPLGDKTFYYRRADDTWYDSEIPAGETPRIDSEIEAWSDAFFELIAREPALRGYILGGDAKQVIKLGERHIRIQ